MGGEQLATFSENVLSNNIMAKADDRREFLYSHNKYIPITALNAVVWSAGEHHLDKVPDIVDKGDRIVSRLIMEAIMAWDPYGVLFMPATLKSTKRELTDWYVMSINNIVDVINEEDSAIFMRDMSDYDLPPELVVDELYICAEKYKAMPEHKKHIFRIKGSDDTIFFSTELVNHVWDIAKKNDAIGLVQTPFYFDEEAPIF